MLKVTSIVIALFIINSTAESQWNASQSKVCEHVHAGIVTPYSIVSNSQSCPVYQHQVKIKGNVYSETHAMGLEPIFIKISGTDEVDPTNRDCYTRHYSGNL